MNVNGARFRLLLGRADWARCLQDDSASALPLATWWDFDASPMPLPPVTLPAWDLARSEITLQPRHIALPATTGEAPLQLDARRSAAADRHGNVYRVGDDAGTLQVTSSGTGNESLFWPVDRPEAGVHITAGHTGGSAFEPHEAVAARIADRYLALAVTADDHLVVAFARGAQRGLMSFDLVAGGDPVETAWPAGLAFEPFDLCARHGGGVWVLDRVVPQGRLWELDCTLAVVHGGQVLQTLAPAEPDDFQPLAGTPRARPVVEFPAGLDLASIAVRVTDPVAIEALGTSSVLVLDRDAAQQRSRVIRVRRAGANLQADASQWLSTLPALAHDMVYAAAPRLGQASEPRLFIASAVGNQVHGFDVVDSVDDFALRAPAELFPLRRYGGRALLAVRGAAHYDSGLEPPRWTGVVQQPRRHHEPVAEFVTPVLDAGEPGITWDKLMLDACIPADTAIEIESRCGDECSPAALDEPLQVIGSWHREPAPQLRSTGPELPWLRGEAARTTRRESGAGTWELLFQQAQGGYLQLRVRLLSHNGTGTPRLRALRAWAPRFSYPERFLPAVYREDPAGGRFLERWLANFESTLTQIEDRVANVQVLFDARSVPDEALGWLAQWFDLALDPAWDERRHRLLVQHAMDFFRWRGTVHGLRLALELVFNPCFDAAMFGGPRSLDDGARRVRIVEAYQTRLTETLTGSAATRLAASADGLRSVPVQAARWTPAEGNEGLVERLARAQGRTATTAERVQPFALVPPADEADQATWASTLSDALGFVPAAGAAERARWQGYLLSLYAQYRDGSVVTDELNRRHGTAHASFDQVPLPADLPADATLAADWQAFRERGDGLRERFLWADFLARRYRRIERLQRAHRSAWPAFADVPLPDQLPATVEAQVDWLQFERQLLAMHRTAHRFSVLLPVDSVGADPYQMEEQLGLARRIVELEKPAHTVFDVRFYWAFNRVGEARLGLDTQLGAGSRAPELIPDAVVGRAYLGASFVGGPPRVQGRERLSIDC